MTLSGNPWFLFLVFAPMIGAFIGYVVGRKNKAWRDFFAMFIVAVTSICMIYLAFIADKSNPPFFEWNMFMGFRLYFRLDGFRAIYGLVTAFMWLATTLFSREYFTHYRNRNRYYLFSLLTFGATLGVFLSADLITTFIFFEVMSLTSYVLVIHDEKKATLEAARTYVAIAIIGGLALLFGIFIIANHLQTTEIAMLHSAMQNYSGNMGVIYFAAACMLVGFGGKAGMYPLHIWLPNAHPVAPAPASALLSGVLTKTGVFGIIIIGAQMFHGQEGFGLVMLNIGIVGMFTGALLALFSTDLKRTLAYSSVSQIGFIILGVGMQGILSEYYNSMPIQGTLLHMVNHSLIKLLLFMAAGVIVMNIHELELNKIRGFARGKPLLIFCFLMGGLALIGMPFISGYISKTLLHESLVYHIWGFKYYSPQATYFQIIEGIFTLTGGLTTAYVIKLFVCICIEKNPTNQKKFAKLNNRYMSKLSSAVLLVCAIALPVLGVIPNLFMIPIGTFGQEFMLRFYPPYEIDFWAWINLRGAIVSMVIGVVIYTVIVRTCLTTRDESGQMVYVNYWPAALDIEKGIYRPLLLRLLPFTGALIARILSSILPVIAAKTYSVFMTVYHFWQIESQAAKPPDLQKAAHDAGAALAGKPMDLQKTAHDLGAALDNESKHATNTMQSIFAKFTSGYMADIFGSLAYSLLVFLIGFVIIQIIIFS